jgi:hypothetical protein
MYLDAHLRQKIEDKQLYDIRGLDNHKLISKKQTKDEKDRNNQQKSQKKRNRKINLESRHTKKIKTVFRPKTAKYEICIFRSSKLDAHFRQKIGDNCFYKFIKK